MRAPREREAHPARVAWQGEPKADEEQHQQVLDAAQHEDDETAHSRPELKVGVVVRRRRAARRVFRRLGDRSEDAAPRGGGGGGWLLSEEGREEQGHLVGGEGEEEEVGED